MGDMGDDFRAMREHSQRKRAANREQSADILKRAGVTFTVRNGGAHLIVVDRFDFFPGTGLWIDRKSGFRGRGVHGLICEVQKN